MLPYFPIQADDELLFSRLARASSLNSLGTPRASLEVLFGTSSLTSSIDFPVHLHTLWGRFPHIWRSAHEIIEEGTIYPYYRPFSWSHERVMGILLHGGARGLRMFMGHTANGFGNVPQLRYCPECVRLDRGNGFAYWHRAHHLPGVVVCAVHSAILVPLFGAEKRWTKKLVLPPQREGEIIGCVAAGQLAFSQLSWDLLCSGSQPLDPLRLNRLYLEALRERGLVRWWAGVHKPDCLAIVSQVRQHYADFVGFSHRARLLSSPNTPLQWICALLKRPHVASHPICHLLLLAFLFGSVREFLARYEALSSAADDEEMALPHPMARRVDRLRRKEWSGLLKLVGSSKTARSMAPATYAWLYRNDREWLLRVNAGSVQQGRTNNRVDWVARDQEMCERARTVAGELIFERPRQRLSISRIRRALGETAARDLARLPNLQVVMVQLAETAAAYHRRRIDEAILELQCNSRTMTWSNIQRAAGIRAWTATLQAHALLSVESLGLLSGALSQNTSAERP